MKWVLINKYQIPILYAKLMFKLMWDGVLSQKLSYITNVREEVEIGKTLLAHAVNHLDPFKLIVVGL